MNFLPIRNLNSGADRRVVPNSTDSFPDMMENLLVGAGKVSPLMHVFLFLYRFLAEQLGIDPSIIVTYMGMLWGLSKVVFQLYSYADYLIDRHFMCAIYISEDDEIYNFLMMWLSQHASIKRNQNLMAQTVSNSAWDDADGPEDALDWIDAGEGDGNKYLNFSKANKSSSRYVPARGSTSFRDKGTYFMVDRKKESHRATPWMQEMRPQEELKITCFGRSIAPIKRLLADAKALYYNDTSHKTTVYRPRVKDMRRGWSWWQQVAHRPDRPMQTVVLDPTQKRKVLQDINDYLHPATPKWYAARGIPLRRGYLFHGPPGTGKTSFSFALAGVFGIDIYVISLQDANITEEDLASFFTQLPRRCVILLEDIDTAGLRRSDNEAEAPKDDSKKNLTNGEMGKKEEAEEKTSKTVDSETSKKKDEKKAKSKEDGPDSDSEHFDFSKHRSRKKVLAKGGIRGIRDGNMNGATSESISLSGLLNAIDGVASHEGRVLIMTTNKPESLDEALLRPGRVDMQVAFRNATRQQAEELFRRMYEGLTPLSEAVPGSTGAAKPERPIHISTSRDQATDAADMMWQNELVNIAHHFGRLVPEERLSPADIQGFLLKRKRSPRKALDEAEEWIKATLKQKEEKSKVKTVQ